MRIALKFTFSVFFLLSASFSFSQYYYYNNKYYDNNVVFEFGGSLGAMNCITDLGGQKKFSKKYLNEINWKNTKLAGGVYISAIYQQVVALRLEAVWGEVEAFDSLLPVSNRRFRRNLSFRSSIREVSVVAEFHPTMLKYYEEPPLLSPYILAGVGWFSFSPQGKLNGNWVDLQPLRTEGQGFKEYPDRIPYKLSQANLIMGLGVKYELSPMVNLRLEWVHRYLFTDYLDDASTTYIDAALFSNYLTPRNSQQANLLYKRIPGAVSKTLMRGDPGNNDLYFSVNLKVGITLGRSRR